MQNNDAIIHVKTACIFVTNAKLRLAALKQNEKSMNHKYCADVAPKLMVSNYRICSKCAVIFQRKAVGVSRGLKPHFHNQQSLFHLIINVRQNYVTNQSGYRMSPLNFSFKVISLRRSFYLTLG